MKTTMKTVEEVAREIDREYEMMSRPEGNIAAIIRADREEVLRRVEESFNTGVRDRGNLQKSVHKIGLESFAAVKKEVCG